MNEVYPLKPIEYLYRGYFITRLRDLAHGNYYWRVAGIPGGPSLYEGDDVEACTVVIDVSEDRGGEDGN